MTLWDMQRCCLALSLLSAWASSAEDGHVLPPEAAAQCHTLLDGARLVATLISLSRGEPRGHAFAADALLQVQKQQQQLLLWGWWWHCGCVACKLSNCQTVLVTTSSPQCCAHLAVFPVEAVGQVVPALARLLDAVLLEEDVEGMAGQEAVVGLTSAVKQAVNNRMVGHWHTHCQCAWSNSWLPYHP